MNLLFSNQIKKEIVFEDIKSYINKLGLKILKSDESRPWGGFLVINEEQSQDFINIFFSSLSEKELRIQNRISPKILIVAPGKRLSWQYHYRRSEIWKAIGGEVGIVVSDTDEENQITKYNSGSIIQLKKGERHRLIGLDGWGIIAEIWQHTDANDPSNEEDIVRLQDDYGR